MKRQRFAASVAAIAAVIAFVPVGAQNAAQRPMELEDILSYRTMGQTVLSADGQWFGYRMAPLDGDNEVIVRNTATDKELHFEVGDGNGSLAFSGDSSWVAMATAPTQREADAARRSNRPVQNGVTIANLATGQSTVVQKVRRFEFNGELGGWLALDRYGPEGTGGAVAAGRGGRGGRGGGGGAAAPLGDRARGTDLILHNLENGQQINIGNVAEFAFDESGRYLALLIDAADQVGNGIQLRDMTTGALTSLETDEARFERLSWSDDGDALVALKGKTDSRFEDRVYSVVGLRGFAAGTPVRVGYEPSSDTTFPAGMGISRNRAPQWTRSGDAISFGIAELTPAESRGPAGRGSRGGRGGRGADASDDTQADNEDRPNLVIWHYQDPRLQSMQEVQESRDRSFNYLSIYHVADQRFVRLADDMVPDVSLNDRGVWALGSSDDEHELRGNLDGQRYRDVYAVDTRTGAKTLLKPQVRWGYALSPDSTKWLYYEDRHFHVMDVATGTSRNITEGVGATFVDVEDDHNVADPPSSQMGWSADSAAVLLSDEWDVWKVPVAEGEPAVNLTVNGKTDAIRYRSRVRIDPDEDGVDLAKPQYFSALAEWTKQAGYGLLRPGQPGVTMLVWDEAQFGRLQKADKADTWIYTRETVTEAGDVFVTDAALANGRRITDLGAEAESYRWSAGAQLLEFKNEKGARLQASLYLPANYQPGQQYPTIVYIYERLTQNHFQYGRPTANGFSRQAYTSNGYAVLMPDISYYVNDPGMSAVWALRPAVKAAIETGVVDPDRVGLHGHSWGGYQTAFTITQTDAFAAAIAGAPLTNMISMYALIYKNTGGTNGAIFEASQGRFTSGPWDEWDAYTRNSPVAFAANVTTPLMMLHNDQDGAVDFTQGVEYFNTLRRLEKPVIMLEYPGENHGLRRAANQQDYTVRMKEFFDHHLKGAEAPDWLEHGVPRLDMDKHIDERLKARRDKATPPPPSGGGR